jgi:hypothetical protein
LLLCFALFFLSPPSPCFFFFALLFKFETS